MFTRKMNKRENDLLFMYIVSFPVCTLLSRRHTYSSLCVILLLILNPRVNKLCDLLPQ